jgi:oligopeptide/dipeptide ABC transporter ATP-binding protein
LDNLIEIKNLFVEYKLSKGFLNEQKTVFAVNGLSLDIKKGEVLAIAGESGCGKSTLGKAILRLVETKSGEILFDSAASSVMLNSFQHRTGEHYGDSETSSERRELQNILKLNKKELKNFRQNAQIIFQNPYSSLNPKMKVYDIVKEPLIVNKELKTLVASGQAISSMSDNEVDKMVKDAIKQVGLDERALYLYPHEFSGGQRQRIAIARALIMNPQFIVADEPVSALDVSIQAQIINLLKELKEKFNLTFLFISHDLSVIKYLSDRVAIMYLGEIVEIGTSDEIFNSPMHPYTQALLSAAPGLAKEKKIILSGDLPSPTDLPAGCKFHTRCPHSMSICKTVQPEITEFSATHNASCHLFDLTEEIFG